MLEIKSNLLATDRMLKYLETDQYFNVENSDDLGAIIPAFVWYLLLRTQGKSGQTEIVKGPHYQKTSVTISVAAAWPRSHLFRITGRIICVMFSRDLAFDDATEYKIDISNGEVYVYPSVIDSVKF